MGHATDIVAYTYNADTYCPGCIAQMFQEDAKLVSVQAQWLSTEDILKLAAKNLGIDYDDEYSYDSDNFPKVVFSSQANDADYDHCCNMHDKEFEEVCDGHIDHDENDCRKWRGVEESDDFSGRHIIWTSLGNEFVLEMHRVYENVKEDPGKDRWSYELWDYGWTDESSAHHPKLFDNAEYVKAAPIFKADDFESPVYNEAPAIVGGLLGFLSLQPGDTDAEHFDNYTERQTNWMEDRAETLSLIQYDQFD